MRTPLLGAERTIMSSTANRSIGKSGDLFPQLQAGELTLTTDRLVFEAERLDDEDAQVEIPLVDVMTARPTWIRLLDLVPMYPSLEVQRTDRSVERFAVVRSGAVKPAEWAGAINAARANMPIGSRDRPAASEPPAEVPSSPAKAEVAGAQSKSDPMPWIIAALPLVGGALEFMAGARLAALGAVGIFFLYLVANTLLCLLDARKLHSEGLAAPETWAIFLVPVYLWKRAATLGRTQAPTLLWLACFIASFFISQQGEKAQVTETACSVVTQIIQGQLNGTAYCKRVSVTDDLGSGFYTGRAILDNGRELRITIENRGGEIYVQIPPQ